MSWPLVFSIIFVVSILSITADDPCRFEDPLKGVIDLTSIARTDGQPSFVSTRNGMCIDLNFSATLPTVTPHCRI